MAGIKQGYSKDGLYHQDRKALPEKEVEPLDVLEVYLEEFGTDSNVLRILNEDSSLSRMFRHSSERAFDYLPVETSKSTIVSEIDGVDEYRQEHYEIDTPLGSIHLQPDRGEMRIESEIDFSDYL